MAEVFLQNNKPGSQSDVTARDGAIAASIALQLGCPLEDLQRALLRNADGSAAGPLGTAIDAIVRQDHG